MEPKRATPWADSGSAKTRTRAQRLAALMFSLGITAILFLYRDRIAQFSAYSYLGLLVVSMVGNATVLLPVPSLAATFVAGGIFNPLLAGAVSGVGMAVGELSGYLAGYGGTAIVDTKDSAIFQRLQRWMRDHGFLTILILSAIPNPFFDLAGIAAGMSHYPLAHFLIACFLGKSIKGLAFALAGAQSVPWLERFLH
jgi:uncharacterized membrane protein YdjX (TVP38/TMEM64 family)